MIYEKNLTVPASSTDYTVGVGVVGAVTFMQDIMCDFFGELKCDGLTMIPICNAFFVITKTKFKFHKNVFWGNNIKLKTSVIDTSKIRVNLNNSVYSGDSLCIEGIQELCPIDKDSRKLRMVDSTLFPKDVTLEEKNGLINYTKFNFNLEDFKLEKSIKIDISNIDFYKHTNKPINARNE